MDPGSPLYHMKHIFRAGFLFFLGIVGLIVLRSALEPDTWGQYGPYRGASVLEYQAIPARHGGSAACGDCHEDALDEVRSGVHESVSCELCHGALAVHVQDGEWIADMPIKKSADLCLLCHEAMVARPASFPQIQPKAHVEENGETFTPTVCFECHEPHSPF